jgi:hypothetical protein
LLVKAVLFDIYSNYILVGDGDYPFHISLRKHVVEKLFPVSNLGFGGEWAKHLEPNQYDEDDRPYPIYIEFGAFALAVAIFSCLKPIGIPVILFL